MEGMCRDHSQAGPTVVERSEGSYRLGLGRRAWQLSTALSTQAGGLEYNLQSTEVSEKLFSTYVEEGHFMH